MNHPADYKCNHGQLWSTCGRPKLGTKDRTECRSAAVVASCGLAKGMAMPWKLRFFRRSGVFFLRRKRMKRGLTMAYHHNLSISEHIYIIYPCV